MKSVLILSLLLSTAFPMRALASPNNYPSLETITQSSHLTGNFNFHEVPQVQHFMRLMNVESILGSQGFQFMRMGDFETYTWNDGSHLVVVDFNRGQVENVRTLGSF